MPRRVVITGIGIVSPLGSDRESSWATLCKGVSGLTRIRFSTPQGPWTTIGAPAYWEFSPSRQTASATSAALAAAGNGDRISRSPNASSSASEDATYPLFDGDLLTQPDRLWQMTRSAAEEAVADAGLTHELYTHDDVCGDPARLRFGCSVASSKGNLHAHTAALSQMQETGYPPADWWYCSMPDQLSRRLSGRFGLAGPTTCPVAACATGLLSAITAANWIADGYCDLALSGSSDTSLSPLVLGSYRRLGVLAPFDVESGDDVERVVRPFSRDRNGFAVGEGSAVFVLESAERALQRGATIYGELAGWACATDAQSMVSFSEKPSVMVHCLKNAMAKAALEPAAIGHLNCHGTATKPNDAWETAGVKEAFGPASPSLAVTANKSMSGHLLGASGSFELANTVLALRDQFVPPTMNLEDPDPECDLDYTALEGRPHSFDAAAKLSFGFGGHIAAVIIKRWHP